MRMNRFERRALYPAMMGICFIGEGESTPGADNSVGAAGGNNDSGTNDSGTSNNAGSTFNAEAFWKEPVAETPTGTTPTATTTTTQAPTGQSIGQQFATNLAAMTFGEPVFNDKAVAGLAQGNVEQVNESLTNFGRQTVQQAVLQTAHIMKEFGNSIRANMAAQIQAALGNRDNNESITSSFPAAKDPALRPMIEGVFNQAMKHTNGDRPKAVAMAQGMLKYMGANAHEDLGIERAPTGPGDTMTAGAKSLVDELLAR